MPFVCVFISIQLIDILSDDRFYYLNLFIALRENQSLLITKTIPIYYKRKCEWFVHEVCVQSMREIVLLFLMYRSTILILHFHYSGFQSCCAVCGDMFCRKIMSWWVIIFFLFIIQATYPHWGKLVHADSKLISEFLYL